MKTAITLTVLSCLAVAVRCQPANVLSELGGNNGDIPAEILAIIGSTINGGPIEGGTVEWPILGGAGVGEQFNDGLRNGWDGNPGARRGAVTPTVGPPAPPVVPHQNMRFPPPQPPAPQLRPVPVVPADPIDMRPPTRRVAVQQMPTRQWQSTVDLLPPRPVQHGTAAGIPRRPVQRGTVAGMPSRPIHHGTAAGMPSRPVQHGIVAGMPSRPVQRGAVAGMPSRPIHHGTAAGMPSRPVQRGTVAGMPSRPIHHGTAAGMPSRPVQHGTAAGLPSRPVQHGTVAGMPQRPVQHGTVAGMPSRQVHHGTAAGMPSRQVHHGTVAGMPSRPVQHDTAAGMPSRQVQHGTAAGMHVWRIRNRLSPSERPMTRHRGHVSHPGGVIPGVPNVPVVPEANPISLVSFRGIQNNNDRTGLLHSVETRARAVILGRKIYHHESTATSLGNPTAPEIQAMSVQPSRTQKAELYNDLTSQLTTGKLHRSPTIVPLSKAKDPFINDPVNRIQLPDVSRPTRNHIHTVGAARIPSPSVNAHVPRPMHRGQSQTQSVQLQNAVVPSIRQSARISTPNFHKNPSLETHIPRTRHIRNRQHSGRLSRHRNPACRPQTQTGRPLRKTLLCRLVQRPADILGQPLIKTGPSSSPSRTGGY